MVRIHTRLEIPDDELTLVASRSSGPGGQNVNKVATRMTLRFDVANSPTLSPTQKDRIERALHKRIDKEGILQLSSQEHRTQAGNREAVLARFATLLADALRPRKPRRPTHVPRAEKRRRLEHKRRQSEKKQLRRKPGLKE